MTEPQLCQVCAKHFDASEPPQTITIDITPLQDQPRTVFLTYTLRHIGYDKRQHKTPL